MSGPTQRRKTVVVVAAIALSFWSLATGCHHWTGSELRKIGLKTPGKQQSDKDEAQTDKPSWLAALSQDTWVRTFVRPGEVLADHALRWRHPALEELLAQQADHQPDWKAALAWPDPTVSANAAIALARLHDSRAGDRLQAAIRDPGLKLPLRRAAIEALSMAGSSDRLDALRNLAIDYAKFSGDAARTYVPELHAELLYALARHEDAADDPLFQDAVRSPALEVRMAALEAWCKSGPGPLPAHVADLRTDPAERVRAGAMRALAARRLPESCEYLARGLADHSLDVRLAAIDALGNLPGDAAEAELLKLLNSDAEIVRTATVRALAAHGADDGVRMAADDKSWRVRRAVAAQLRGNTPADATLARRFLEDRSAEVQRQTVSTLESWPLAAAGPLWLEAMAHSTYQSRKAAAELLAQHWPPAQEFSADAPVERRAEQLALLTRTWRKEHGTRSDGAAATEASSPERRSFGAGELERIETLVERYAGDNPERAVEARDELLTLGPGLADACELLVIDRQRHLPDRVYRELLPGVGRDFEALARLTSTNVDERRRAATLLEKIAASAPLRPLAIARASELGVKEADPLVCLWLIRSLGPERSAEASEMLYAAATHRSADVRLLACQKLSEHPQPGDAAILLPALDDENIAVVKAAAAALGHRGMLKDPSVLERLLAKPDKSVRLAAAKALARMGSPIGQQALERLAHDEDAEIRRQTARAMGDLADPVYLPSLIDLLDDHLGARPAAFDALTHTAPPSVVAANNDSSLSLAEKIERWKQWRAGQSRGARSR